MCSWVLGTRFLVSCRQMCFPPSLVFQDRVAFDPGVIHRSLEMSLLLSGWLKEILNSTVQQQLCARLIIAGACRCLAESWVGMHPEILRGKKWRGKWEILSCTGPVECLTIIIFDGIIITQSSPTPSSHIPPLSYYCTLHSPCRSDMSETGNLTLQSQVSTSSKGSLSLQFLFRLI